MADGRIMIATQGAMFDYEGQKVFIVEGKTTAREGHPVLKGREGLFKPLVPEFEIEQGTATAPKQTAKTRRTQVRDNSGE